MVCVRQRPESIRLGKEGKREREEKREREREREKEREKERDRQRGKEREQGSLVERDRALEPVSSIVRRISQKSAI